MLLPSLARSSSVVVIIEVEVIAEGAAAVAVALAIVVVVVVVAVVVVVVVEAAAAAGVVVVVVVEEEEEVVVEKVLEGVQVVEVVEVVEVSNNLKACRPKLTFVRPTFCAQEVKPANKQQNLKEFEVKGHKQKQGENRTSHQMAAVMEIKMQ